MRGGIYAFLGVVFLVVFPADVSMSACVMSFAVTGCHLVNAMIYRAFGERLSLQWMSILACTIEASLLMVGTTSMPIDHDASGYVVSVIRQYFLLGAMSVALKFIYAFPKVSLLRFTSLCIVLFLMLVAELVAFLLLIEPTESGGPGLFFYLIFAIVFDLGR